MLLPGGGFRLGTYVGTGLALFNNRFKVPAAVVAPAWGWAVLTWCTSGTVLYTVEESVCWLGCCGVVLAATEAATLCGTRLRLAKCIALGRKFALGVCPPGADTRLGFWRWRCAPDRLTFPAEARNAALGSLAPAFRGRTSDLLCKPVDEGVAGVPFFNVTEPSAAALWNWWGDRLQYESSLIILGAGEDSYAEGTSSVSESGSTLVTVRLICPDVVFMVLILTLGIAGGDPDVRAGDALPLLSLQMLTGLSDGFINRFIASRGLLGLRGDMGTLGLAFKQSLWTAESLRSFLGFRATRASRQDDNLDVWEFGG